MRVGLAPLVGQLLIIAIVRGFQVSLKNSDQDAYGANVGEEFFNALEEANVEDPDAMEALKLLEMQIRNEIQKTGPSLWTGKKKAVSASGLDSTAAGLLSRVREQRQEQEAWDAEELESRKEQANRAVWAAAGKERKQDVVAKRKHQEWVAYCEYQGEMGKSCTKRCRDVQSQDVFECQASRHAFSKKGKYLWCVPAETRCDTVSNCADGSDEEGCPALCQPAVLQEELYARQTCLPVLQGLACADKGFDNCPSLTSNDICSCFSDIGVQKLQECNVMMPTFGTSIQQLAVTHCGRHNELLENYECGNFLSKQACFNEKGTICNADPSQCDSCRGLDLHADVCPCIQKAYLLGSATPLIQRVPWLFQQATRMMATTTVKKEDTVKREASDRDDVEVNEGEKKDQVKGETKAEKHSDEVQQATTPMKTVFKKPSKATTAIKTLKDKASKAPTVKKTLMKKPSKASSKSKVTSVPKAKANPSKKKVPIMNKPAMANPSKKKVPIMNKPAMANPSKKKVPIMNKPAMANPSKKKVPIMNKPAMANPSKKKVPVMKKPAMASPTNKAVSNASRKQVMKKPAKASNKKSATRK